MQSYIYIYEASDQTNAQGDELAEVGRKIFRGHLQLLPVDWWIQTYAFMEAHRCV